MKVLSPLTATDEVKLLEVISTKKLIEAWKSRYLIDINDEFNNKENIYLYLCNRTQLKFFVPGDTAGSSKLYAQLQQFPWYYMTNKWEHQIALQEVKNCHNIMEVGCGSGAFVKQGINIGLNVSGIDININAILSAKQQGLPVNHLDLKTAAEVYENSFDAVCSFQVLEHVAEPYAFIEYCIQMLKTDGKLIYCVPNSSSYIKHQTDNLLNMPPHHMLQWSKQAFSSLEELFPIKLEKVIFEPLQPYHIVPYLRSHSNQYLPLKIQKLLFNRCSLPFLQMGMDMFNIRRTLIGHSLYAQFRKNS